MWMKAIGPKTVMAYSTAKYVSRLSDVWGFAEPMISSRTSIIHKRGYGRDGRI